MNKDLIPKGSMWPLGIVLTTNFVLCCVSKVLSLQQGAYGPLVFASAFVFPFVLYKKLWAEVIYYVLLVPSLFFAVFGAMIFLAIRLGHVEYVYLIPLCVVYLLTFVIHVIGCVLVIRRRRRHGSSG